MPLSIIIGKNSLDQPIEVDICNLPYLFLTYSYDEQLLHFLQHCINTLNNNYNKGKKLSIAIALG